MKHALLLLSLFAMQAQAQIIYTDVVPDSVYNVNGDTCFLDLNNDTTTDFYIRYYKKPGNACSGCTAGPPLLHPSWVKIDPLITNAVANSVSSPSDLMTGSPIDASLLWDTVGGEVLASQTSQCVGTSPTLCVPHASSGEWMDDSSSYSPRFLGLRFESGGSTYYGWAQLRVAADAPLVVSSFTLRDYAYNSVPDEFILAGDTGTVISTGVAQLAPTSVQVTPNPFTSTISVSIGAQKAGDVTCTVLALTGEALVSQKISGTWSSFMLDLGSLAPGIYLMEVMIDEERIVRRVMRE